MKSVVKRTFFSNGKSKKSRTVLSNLFFFKEKFFLKKCKEIEEKKHFHS